MPTPDSLPADQALCDAAASGDLRRVRRLLAEGADADSADEDGTTALMAAAFAGEPAVVGELVAAGADVNLQDEAGLTALMNAVIADGEMDLDGGHPVFLEIVEMLLNAEADPEVEDQNGYRALEYAIEYGLRETTERLQRA